MWAGQELSLFYRWRHRKLKLREVNWLVQDHIEGAQSKALTIQYTAITNLGGKSYSVMPSLKTVMSHNYPKGHYLGIKLWLIIS